MTTTTFLVDGVPMPLGHDDIREYLEQFGTVVGENGWFRLSNAVGNTQLYIFLGEES